MKCIDTIEDLSSLSCPIVATIGTFDGIHLGHRSVLKHLKQAALEKQAKSLVITFQSHPKSILNSKDSVCMLCTPSQKERLLSEQGIDFLANIAFTPELSQLSSEEFLGKIYQQTPLLHLVLGHDARFGHQRKGSPEVIQEIGKKLGFSVNYVKAKKKNEELVSSSAIRKLIHRGKLKKAAQFLGRPYGLQGLVIPSSGRGRQMGSPTANIAITNLCLPPLGVYAVTIKVQNQLVQGVANLGIAPTLRDGDEPVLEVHVFQFSGNLYGEELEVQLHHFIRPERRFETVEALQNQIQKDIQIARSLLAGGCYTGS